MQSTRHRNESHQAAATAAPRRRLLCASDLTVRSERAVRRAGLLARQIDAAVRFVHAVEPRGSGRLLRMKVNRAFARLLAESERATRRTPDEAAAVVHLGKPLEAISAAAREWNPDLIVMAKPRRRHFDTVVGTTAERVVRSTGRSVLLADCVAERPYERVVLATDPSSAPAEIARSMLELGILANAHACVVHAFGADLARVHVSIERARPLEAIRRAIDHVNPELVVIGVCRWLALERVFVGSVADQVFRNVSCDILAISASTRGRSQA